MQSNEQLIATRATAHQLGIALGRTFEHCKICATSKIKKKNLPKASVSNMAKVKREREFIWACISSIQYLSYGGSKYWTLLVDEVTKRC